jgi:hypothetical protein
MSPLLGHRPSYGLNIKRTGHNPPRGTRWWVLTTANAAGTNSFAFRSTEELDLIYFHTYNDWPMLLSFRDRTPIVFNYQPINVPTAEAQAFIMRGDQVNKRDSNTPDRREQML